MGEHKERMLRGRLYRANDPELVAERWRAQELCEQFNRTAPDEAERRGELLRTLLGKFGEGSWIMPRFQCDYGYLVEIGANSFLDYDAILLDCARITIGDDVSTSEGRRSPSGRECSTRCRAAAVGRLGGACARVRASMVASAGFVHRPDAVREPVGFSGVGTARGREPAVGSSA